MRKRGKLLAAVPIALALTVSACTTPTPYQPLTRGGQASGGYSEQRIEDNRWVVRFTGNSLTSRQRVETYLLYRAAELTLQLGYDGFTMVHRDTDQNVRTHVYHDPWGPGPWGYWGPSWRYWHRGRWGYWDPWGPGPFWGGVDVHTVTRYEAIAEIVMFRGPRSGDPASFDARQVTTNLRPTIEYPRP
jgi:hypothetical protein